MKYAVLGAAGQLGRDLTPRLTGEVIPLDRTRADLTRPETLRETLTALRPDVVVTQELMAYAMSGGRPRSCGVPGAVLNRPACVT